MALSLLAEVGWGGLGFRVCGVWGLGFAGFRVYGVYEFRV